MIACGGISESDIEATVEARVTEERATEATVEARAQAIAKAMVEATAEAAPTAKPVPPTATPTLVPTTPTPAQVQVITPLPGQPFVVENEATAVALREMPTPTVVPATITPVPPTTTPTTVPTATPTKVPRNCDPNGFCGIYYGLARPTTTQVPPTATPYHSYHATQVPPTATPTATPTQVPPTATPTATPTPTPMPFIESFDGRLSSGMTISTFVDNYTKWNLVNNSNEQIKVLTAVLRDQNDVVKSTVNSEKMIEIFGTEIIAPGSSADLKTSWAIAPTSELTSLWTFETETEGLMQCIFSSAPKKCTKITPTPTLR